MAFSRLDRELVRRRSQWFMTRSGAGRSVVSPGAEADEFTVDLSACQIRTLYQGIEVDLSVGPADISLTGISATTSLLHCVVALDLAVNDIVVLENLSQLRWLRELNASINQIKQIEPMHELLCLTALNISHNRISDLKPVFAAISLQFLDVSYNNIGQLDGISALTSLEELRACHTNLMSLLPLESLSRLRSLEAEDNELLTVDSLCANTALQVVNLSANRLHDLESLCATLSKLPLLYSVRFSDNPFCLVDAYKYELVLRCPQLMVVDGVSVSQATRSALERLRHKDHTALATLEAKKQLDEQVYGLSHRPLFPHSMIFIIASLL
jgi:hypothetical protein